ncbi:MAG: hypothetical protein AUK28_09795 [Desulfobacterales bacterium CG2_30_60_27]|nr:MAG: hypothetical protein AUK28_09795 [Desulfobacterales bacterium CG2_30_60_27]
MRIICLVHAVAMKQRKAAHCVLMGTDILFFNHGLKLIEIVLHQLQYRLKRVCISQRTIAIGNRFIKFGIIS